MTQWGFQKNAFQNDAFLTRLIRRVGRRFQELGEKVGLSVIRRSHNLGEMQNQYNMGEIKNKHSLGGKL